MQSLTPAKIALADYIFRVLEEREDTASGEKFDFLRALDPGIREIGFYRYSPQKICVVLTMQDGTTRTVLILTGGTG